MRKDQAKVRALDLGQAFLHHKGVVMNKVTGDFRAGQEMTRME
jgi:hypothetical protein